MSDGKTVIGEPTGAIGGIPSFDTNSIVDWTCPSCDDNGFNSPRTADMYPLCTNRDCAVKMFSVFRSQESGSGVDCSMEDNDDV